VTLYRQQQEHYPTLTQQGYTKLHSPKPSQTYWKWHNESGILSQHSAMLIKQTTNLLRMNSVSRKSPG